MYLLFNFTPLEARAKYKLGCVYDGSETEAQRV